MEFIDVHRSARAAADFKRLYTEAFPKVERAPLSALKRRAKKKSSDCISVYDGDRFVGLLNLIYDRDVVFLFFFAVAADVRGQGYGTRILAALKEQHPDSRIVINIEIPDETSPNSAQRVRRKQFYLRCGFTDCHYNLIERGVEYEVLSYNGIVAREELQALIKRYMGGLLYRLIYKWPAT